MKPARDAILWAAQNRWLSEHLPRFRFVRASVRRFMPGERIDDALGAAGGLATDGIPATFTYLGEHVRTPADADDVAEHYQELLDRIEERRMDAEVSAKPSHLGLALGPNDTFERLRGLAERSATRGRHLFVDMEDSSTVEPTLELYRRLLEATPNVGVCLQAYLHRTPTDVEDVAQGGGSIRLVKGAYREPRELALQRRVEIGRAFVDQAVAFLEVGGGGRLALGTHDLGLIEEIERRAAAAGFGRDAFEVQMLYGIRAADQRRLARDGYRVRVLISYGTHWYPWFMRRLAEHPANVWLALRNLVGRA